MEDRSSSTEENFRFSMELLRERLGNDDPAFAFATTNSHVFRSGVWANRAGLRAEGIGSRTV